MLQTRLSIDRMRLILIHILSASIPKTMPPSAIPRANSRPDILGRHTFNPNQNRAQRKVRIGDIMSHRHDPISISVTGVLVHDRREKVELLLDCHPRLFALRPHKSLCGPIRSSKMCLRAIWQLHMTDWNHDGKKRLREDLLDEVDK